MDAMDAGAQLHVQLDQPRHLRVAHEQGEHSAPRQHCTGRRVRDPQRGGHHYVHAQRGCEKKQLVCAPPASLCALSSRFPFPSAVVPLPASFCCRPASFFLLLLFLCVVCLYRGFGKGRAPPLVRAVLLGLVRAVLLA